MNNPPIDFQGFGKIARWSREVIITEKLDGTNAQVHVSDDGLSIHAGDRNRWLTLEADNFGFARWVSEHKDELLKLGPGRHYGEWWGAGIRRGYGLQEKRFSLFNVSRWADPAIRPPCCDVVPELWRGLMDMALPVCQVEQLRREGSCAAPGFMKPEGVIIFHVASGQLFKKTLENDETYKGSQNE